MGTSTVSRRIICILAYALAAVATLRTLGFLSANPIDRNPINYAAALIT